MLDPRPRDHPPEYLGQPRVGDLRRRPIDERLVRFVARHRSADGVEIGRSVGQEESTFEKRRGTCQCPEACMLQGRTGRALRSRTLRGSHRWDTAAQLRHYHASGELVRGGMNGPPESDELAPAPRERLPRASVMLSATVEYFGGGAPTRHRVRDLSPGGIRIDQEGGMRVGAPPPKKSTVALSKTLARGMRSITADAS